MNFVLKNDFFFGKLAFCLGLDVSISSFSYRYLCAL